MLALDDADSQTPIAIAMLTQISKSTTEDGTDTQRLTDTSEPIDPLSYLAGAPIGWLVSMVYFRCHWSFGSSTLFAPSLSSQVFAASSQRRYASQNAVLSDWITR